MGRVGRLKRFLAPQLAELIVSQGDEKILESHRREIVVVFCDLRGYTAFTETAEPEEVLDFLREYHGALGPLVSQFEGTLDQFSGDGIMVFFNDPVPIPDPAERAVKMAVAMREAAGTLIAAWRERGRELGFGAGIAQGYATLGQIGFSERSGYTAIGTVCNVAARLCAEAKDGQILLSQRVNVALKGSVATEQVGALALKGLTQPVVAYNVPLAASQPALRVIEGGHRARDQMAAMRSRQALAQWHQRGSSSASHGEGRGSAVGRQEPLAQAAMNDRDGWFSAGQLPGREASRSDIQLNASFGRKIAEISAAYRGRTAPNPGRARHLIAANTSTSHQEIRVSQLRDGDHRTVRRRRAEIALAQIGVFVEFRGRRDMADRKNNVLDPRAAGIEAGADVLANLLDLRSHVAFADNIADLVARDLSRR